MKTTIEIKIECKGQAVGTLGWFNSMMQGSEFVIKECKSGAPAMFLKTLRKNGDGFDYYFIAKANNPKECPDGYIVSWDGKFLSEIPESNPYVQGFSDYPLTPACRKKVEEMIESGTEAFREWWENDR